jgi:Coenzyme PQQ synthesis protein D (PqqD)
VFFQTACYKKVTNVRVRGVPEMEFCLVFTPDDPQTFTLNTSAWLVLDLCDGRSEEDIAASYFTALKPLLSREEAQREVRSAIEILECGRIVAKVARRPKRRLAHQTKGESHETNK